MIVTIFLFVSVLVNIVLALLLLRATSVILVFDDVFSFIASDIEVNISYLNKLISSPTFVNSDEVMTANKNMKVMSDRLNEILTRMEESSGKRLRRIQKKATKGVPPVVI